MGEDLLLLAIDPRGGRVRAVRRIRSALRATELIELTMAERIKLDGGLITVTDPTPVGVERLDRVLAWLHSDRQNALLEVWLREGPQGFAMIKEYLTVLTDQGALRMRDPEMREAVDGRPLFFLPHARIEVLDENRRTAALARVDKVARGEEGADAGDRALAAIVHACGLDQKLYRGVFRRSARGRLARLEDYARVTGGTRTVGDAADARFTDGMAQVLSGSLDDLTRLLTAEFSREEGLAASQHGTHHAHHHDSGSSDSTHHGHHSSGWSHDSSSSGWSHDSGSSHSGSDSGGGHHH